MFLEHDWNEKFQGKIELDNIFNDIFFDRRQRDEIN